MKQEGQRSRTEVPWSRASLPIWGSEAIALPASGPLLGNEGRLRPGITTALPGLRGEDRERGCTTMTRFARILAVLSALAAVFMVAGATTKY